MDTNIKSNALRTHYPLLWYRIERILGYGGFGITYLATDTSLKRHVAIKEYLPTELAARMRSGTIHPLTDACGERYNLGLGRFKQEARTLAKFNHPNIVQVHQVFQANNTAYIAMEYEAGRCFHDVVAANGHVDETTLLRILMPLLDALEHVHEAGFVHRDVKPRNIYVRDRGSPMLLDFGSAKTTCTEHTVKAANVVTPGYAPFEQYCLEQEQLGPWTDVYSLAASLYKAIAGCTPHDTFLRGYTMLSTNKDPFVPAIKIGKGKYSPRFLRAVDEALKFLPEQRPQSVAAWRDMLPQLEKPASRGFIQALGQRRASSPATPGRSTADKRVQRARIDPVIDLESMQRSAALVPSDADDASLSAQKRYWNRRKTRRASKYLTLGCRYYTGTGCTQDFVKAFKWMHKSARYGNSIAQYNLGVMYMKGRGVEKNVAAANTWLDKAARQGQPNAQRFLTARQKADAQHDSAATRPDMNGKQTPSPKCLRGMRDMLPLDVA